MMQRIAIEASTPEPTPTVIPSIGPADIFAPLPTRTWMIDRLRIAGGGRPTLVVGPPGAGKTIIVQTLAMACAAGRRWCGVYDVASTSVLHLDAEVGHWLTCSRYQRIASAMGVTPDDLADRLRLSVYPPVTLDAPDAERLLIDTCRGHGLVILDSLSALAGDAEEHTPEVGRLMIMLARVSGETGAAIVVLHHTRRDGEYRGSTAIPAGAECMWRLTDADRGTATLRHERSPMGDPMPDVTASIVDVSVNGDPRGGLAVRLTEPEEHATADTSVDDLVARVVAIVAHRPGCSTRTIREEIGGRAARVDAAIDESIRMGQIHDRGSAKARAYYPGRGP